MFFLNNGTLFAGIPNDLSIADDPSMNFRARVVLGSDNDPTTFFDPKIDALDIYLIDIIQSNQTGLIEPIVSLSNGNSSFSVTFSDSLQTIENRIINAFTGSAGNFQVPIDTFLFSTTVTPLIGPDEEYTFGLGQNATAPDVETPIPEPSSTLALIVLGSLAAIPQCFQNRSE